MSLRLNRFASHCKKQREYELKRDWNVSLLPRRGRFKRAPLTLASALVITLSACGGGGNPADPPPPRLENSSVTTTGNPLVAQYSVTVSGAATVSVEYGTSTSYGSQTSSQVTPAGGGTVIILVAGMMQSTAYHMRADVSSASGVVNDTDHIFQTSAIPADQVPYAQVTIGSGQQPSPGLRLVSALSETFALDSTGDVLWYYKIPGSQDPFYLTKPMSNGHMLILVNFAGPPIDSTLREVDLAGNTIRELTQSDLAQKLTAAGYNINLVSIDHDVLILPNGHWLFIVSDSRTFTDLPGYPGQTVVQGNAVVDVDQNNNPTWVWDAFDHLDVNRHPMNFPDWTHANSLFFVPDDGSFLLSLRHQSWVLKIDYQTGVGPGDVVWKLGYQGDFTLQNSNSPSDWFFAEHDANIVSSNLTGSFQLALWDNGNDRVVDDAGDTCSPSGTPCYSTAAIFNVDETNMTASRAWSYQTPFSYWGGSVQLLANNNVLFDETAPSDIQGSRSIETTQQANPPIIWTLTTPLVEPMYRVKLIPSLYPQQP